jgi:hypothetical protein
VREEGKGEEGRPHGELGRGRKELGCAEKKGKQAARWREERELGWASPGKEKGKKGLVGPGRKEEKRGKRKRESGPGQIRKRGRKDCIQIHLNLNLKFKFKWKTNNKTMQCGMKCTKPIVPYISFYSEVNCY